MTTGEKVLIFIGPVSWTLLLILLVVMIVAAIPAIRPTPRPEDQVASHRALPFWARWGARRGAVKPQPGYGPPPPMTPEPVAPAPQWPLVDTNTVRWPGNPVRNPKPVQVVRNPLDAALTVGQVLADAALRGQVRQPTSMDATQQIEPVRAEVVQ